MIRITVLSLLLGALALIAGLTLLFPPPTPTGQQVPAVTMSAASTKVIAGGGTLRQGVLPLELNAMGTGVVDLASVEIEAQAYPFLHLAFEESSENLQVMITWNTDEAADTNQLYTVESHARKSLWLATTELKGWAGTVSSVRLVIGGRAGEIVRIRNFSLFPASLSRQLRTLFSDMTSYTPWNRAAMNTHTGATQVSSFYPVPLLVAYFLLSLVGYGILLLVFRAKLTFNWRVVALIFLVCWISLDLSWQHRLLHQLADTYRTFSGKNTQEKLAVGPDAKLYDLVTQVKPLLQPKDARVFVISNDEYSGQRAAYFLYPHNVYWSEPGRAFPMGDLWRRGDNVVLLQPSAMDFSHIKNELIVPDRRSVSAELVFSDPRIMLLRLH